LLRLIDLSSTPLPLGSSAISLSGSLLPLLRFAVRILVARSRRAGRFSARSMLVDKRHLILESTCRLLHWRRSSRCHCLRSFLTMLLGLWIDDLTARPKA
jgi:uncharacterized membrane protein YccC